jgi:hypothetical protein
MAVEARAPCGDRNNNNNNNNNNKIIIKLTDFIFMGVFPEIFLSSLEIIFICEQESAREGELSEDIYDTPTIIVTGPSKQSRPRCVICLKG